MDIEIQVVQHVPRINISISHKRCDMGKVKSDMWLLSDIPIFLNLGWGGGRGGGWTEVIKSMDDLSVSRNKIIRNSTQKISSRVSNCNYVTCHMLHVRCRMSHVICQMLMLILGTC